MTAAPGPQQPDEGPHVCDDYETDDITLWVEEIEARPAAPSAQPDEPPMRYPEGRPYWLGQGQPGICDRCLTSQDASEPHPCPSVVCPEHGVEHHPDTPAQPVRDTQQRARDVFLAVAVEDQPVRDTGEGRW